MRTREELEMLIEQAAKASGEWPGNECEETITLLEDLAAALREFLPEEREGRCWCENEPQL